MRFWRWISYVSTLLAVFLGVTSGILLGFLTEPRIAAAGTFSLQVVSWRNHSLRDLDPNQGSSLPMFYTTDLEGHCVGDPTCMPTGVWAPGDTWERGLVVRNAGPDRAYRLSGLAAVLAGNLDLGPWFTLTVLQDETPLFHGTLDELHSGRVPLSPAPLLQPGDHVELIFRVHFDIHTDQRLQGETIIADLAVGAEDAGCPLTGCPTVIDIHPNSWPNPINPGSNGSTPVAVNGSAELDVRTLLGATARFGPAGAAATHWAIEDWNRDGYPDLVLHFPTRHTGVECGMTSMTLTIADNQGNMYTGTDAIFTPGCR